MTVLFTYLLINRSSKAVTFIMNIPKTKLQSKSLAVKFIPMDVYPTLKNYSPSPKKLASTLKKLSMTKFKSNKTSWTSSTVNNNYSQNSSGTHKNQKKSNLKSKNSKKTRRTFSMFSFSTMIYCWYNVVDISNMSLSTMIQTQPKMTNSRRVAYILIIIL